MFHGDSGFIPSITVTDLQGYQQNSECTKDIARSSVLFGGSVVSIAGFDV